MSIVGGQLWRQLKTGLVFSHRAYRTSSLGIVGVAVTDLDLTKSLSEVDKESLRKDVVDHELLVFKKQAGITSEHTVALAQVFGPLEMEPQQGWYKTTLV